jgi:hypothetical protein
MAISRQSESLIALSDFPLMKAIFGRRSRRFGLGMEIPSGPLQFASDSEAVPLSELEQAVLVAAATGVTGWHFGIPFGPAAPEAHANYAVRFTGRTGPTAAGIGTPMLFYTDDDGVYVTDTRDVEPSQMQEIEDLEDDAERVLAICRAHTTKLSDKRLDLPAAPGHMLEPNYWWANTPGSTLFMPVGDASEEMLGLLALLVENGYLIVDTEAGRPAGKLAPFAQSGLLDDEKKYPLAFLETTVHSALCAELSFMAHNIVLTMQAMGLGGLYFGGVNDLSVLGAQAENGVRGLGFRIVQNEEWIVPRVVGLDGVLESLCPPYYPDMSAAAGAFVARKFGAGAAYDSETPGPWKDSAAVKETVSPYSDELVECLGEVAQYVYDKHGSFPGTTRTTVLPGYVQSHHIDTEFYDAHYQPGSYLESHETHWERWHA